MTLTGAFSILVLYARERLGLDDIGFGWLLAASAVGGLAGSLVAARLLERFGASLLLRVGLVIETCTHLSLALARLHLGRSRRRPCSARTRASGM